jgi:Ras-related GTP-binding protein A/B
VKIAGTFFDIQLELKESESNQIELQISKNNEIIQRYNVVDFSDVAVKMDEFLESNGTFLPKNRMNMLLQDLEGIYMELAQKRQRTQNIRVNRQRVTTEALSDSLSKDDIQKILLMGLENAGKTSIYQVIFEGKLPHETQTLRPTRGLERHQIEFPTFGLASNGTTKEEYRIMTSKGGQNITIWDLGGQRSFLERYHQEPELYFGKAACLIFIIDAYNIEHYDTARTEFHRAIEFMKQYGTKTHRLVKSNKIYCFLHKMDLFPNRDERFTTLTQFFREDPVSKEENFDIQFYSTSIFDSSIFSAWTKVIQTIMPKSSKLNLLAQELKEDLGLYAVLIIEKRTGLPICNSKTLLDDSALVGSTNRVLITIEKVLPEFQLANLTNLELTTANGKLTIKQFDKYYILVLLYPPQINICDIGIDTKITQFIDTMKKAI